jgi:preprotein translocase subunit YajC
MLKWEILQWFVVGIARAQEAAATAPKGPSLLEVLIMPAGFLLIMYFFMILPQQKKAKMHSELLSNLKPGDEVLTNGGIIGKVRSVAEGFVSLEISPNTVIKVIKSSISGMSKTQSNKESQAKPGT